jgi:hypothetical protein
VRPAAGLVVALLLAAGCSDDAEPESTTPPIESDEESALADLVLPAESVGSIAGFEGVVAQPLSDVQVFENPDPRGPCGGESPAPPIQGTAGRSFTGEGVAVVQVVADGPEVDEFVDAQLADIVEPCGPYESETNVETTQRVDQIEVVALPDDTGFFSTSRIDDGTQVAYAGSVLVRVDDITSLAFALSIEPIPLSSMESLAALVDAELRAG